MRFFSTGIMRPHLLISAKCDFVTAVPSVCPSVCHTHCVKMDDKRIVEIPSPLDNSIGLVFWRNFYQKFGYPISGDRGWPQDHFILKLSMTKTKNTVHCTCSLIDHSRTISSNGCTSTIHGLQCIITLSDIWWSSKQCTLLVRLVQNFCPVLPQTEICHSNKAQTTRTTFVSATRHR